MIVHGVEFIKAGTAINANSRKQGADFKILQEYKQAKGVVYLFLLDDEIVYIGVTERAIQERMNMYSSNTSGSTNIKMRANLKIDGQYDIYIHVAKKITVGEFVTTNELTIEKALIQNIKTRYNKKVM